jgi:hypothetical protein
MTNWVFGVSSDFSQNMIANLDGETLEFGRHNFSYHPSDIKDWITSLEKLETPTNVIFNINVGDVDELPYPMHDNDTAEQFKTFNKWWADNRNQLFFKTYIINYLITHRNFKSVRDQQVCFITSQISADHDPKWAGLQLYKSLRAIDYEIIWNIRNRDITAYGICPGNNSRPMDWSEYIAKQINTQLLGKEEWLYGIAEQPDKHLDMVKYYHYDPTEFGRLK